MTIHPWQIAVGVIVGVVIGGVGVYQVGHEPIQRLVSDAVESFQRLTDGGTPPSAPVNEKDQQRQSAEEAKDKALRDAQARQLRADQQKAAGGGGSEALQAAARKERAWAKYYKKPPQCDGNPNSDTMMACANQFIRAKREFEEAYAAGKL